MVRPQTDATFRTSHQAITEEPPELDEDFEAMYNEYLHDMQAAEEAVDDCGSFFSPLAARLPDHLFLTFSRITRHGYEWRFRRACSGYTSETGHSPPIQRCVSGCGHSSAMSSLQYAAASPRTSASASLMCQLQLDVRA